MPVFFLMGCLIWQLPFFGNCTHIKIGCECTAQGRSGVGWLAAITTGTVAPLFKRKFEGLATLFCVKLRNFFKISHYTCKNFLLSATIVRPANLSNFLH